jgi:hypothetical protein
LLFAGYVFEPDIKGRPSGAGIYLDPGVVPGCYAVANSQTKAGTVLFSGKKRRAQYILGNGFVVGMLLCMLLEHVLLPKKYFS